MTAALPVSAARSGQLSRLDQLAAIPEEDIWLAKQKSPPTRRAYRLDVQHFMRALGITTTDALRQVDHRAVIAWERTMRETEQAAASTIRRRLSALSSLFKHLVRYGYAVRNPVREIERPTINRESSTAALIAALKVGDLHHTVPTRTGDDGRNRRGTRLGAHARSSTHVVSADAAPIG